WPDLMLEQTCAPLRVERLQREIPVAPVKKEPTQVPYLKVKRSSDALPQCRTVPPSISGCPPISTPCPERPDFVVPSRSPGFSPSTPAAAQGRRQSSQAAFLFSAISV